jgi:hypothetical protein
MQYGFYSVLGEKNDLFHDEQQKTNYSKIVNERSDKMMIIGRTNMLPPHLRGVIDSNPELLKSIMKFLSNTHGHSKVTYTIQ